MPETLQVPDSVEEQGVGELTESLGGQVEQRRGEWAEGTVSKPSRADRVKHTLLVEESAAT